MRPWARNRPLGPCNRSPLCRRGQERRQPVNSNMGATDRFTAEDVQRIVDLTAKQLDYWDHLRLVSPRKEQGNRYYDFRDLIGLRTVKQLVETGVPANRLRRALAALREKLSHAQAPLAELRVFSDGKDILGERGGGTIEPLSRQFAFHFAPRE